MMEKISIYCTLRKKRIIQNKRNVKMQKKDTIVFFNKDLTNVKKILFVKTKREYDFFFQ